MVALDNIETALHGAALCQTLTQPVRRVRRLGASTVVSVPCTALIAATGNNLTLRADVVRRSIVCRLDPQTDRPEERAITQDLIAEATARRGELVRDALTIMAAYLKAGSPEVGVSPLGSFGEWSRMVRAALVWSGAADPCQVMERLREADPERQAIAAVLTAWRDVFGSEGATAREAVQRAENSPELAEALEPIALRNGHLNARTLGTWLRDHRDARTGPLRLAGRKTRTRSLRWHVESESAECAESCRVSPNAREAISYENEIEGAEKHSATLGTLCAPESGASLSPMCW